MKIYLTNTRQSVAIVHVTPDIKIPHKKARGVSADSQVKTEFHEVSNKAQILEHANGLVHGSSNEQHTVSILPGECYDFEMDDDNARDWLKRHRALLTHIGVIVLTGDEMVNEGGTTPKAVSLVVRGIVDEAREAKENAVAEDVATFDDIVSDAYTQAASERTREPTKITVKTRKATKDNGGGW